MSLRICFVSSAHPADDKRVHYKEALTLIEAGHKVTHVVRDDGHPEVMDGVRLVTFKGERSLWRRATQIFRVYRAARSVPADVYHCNEVDSWLAGIFLSRRTGAKVIFDVHEIYSADIAETRFPKPVRPAVRWFVQRVFSVMTRFTDHLVLAKNSVSEDFPASSKSKQITIANYVDLDMDVAASPDVAKAGDACVLLHLGAINRARGWPQMLDALTLTKDKRVELEVIGKFGDGSEAAFLERVRELGLEDRVRFTSWIPYDEVATATRRCDVGIIAFQPVMHSFTHALPHKLFDYMLAELPVIVPDFAVEVGDIVRDNACGVLADVTDPAALAQHFDTLAGSPELRTTYGQRGREAVLERYNWNAEAKRFVDFYRDEVAPSLVKEQNR